MIDITVDHNDREIRIENKIYHFDIVNLHVLIEDIIDQAKYSGESITLWLSTKGDENKHLVKEW